MRPGVFAKAARENYWFPVDWRTPTDEYLRGRGNRAFFDTGEEFSFGDPDRREPGSMDYYKERAADKWQKEMDANPPSELDMLLNLPKIRQQADERFEALTRDEVTNYQDKVLSLAKIRDLVMSPAAPDISKEDGTVRRILGRELIMPSDEEVRRDPGAWKGQPLVTGRRVNVSTFPRYDELYDVLPDSYKGIMSKSNEEFRKFLKALPPTPVRPARKATDLDTLG